jgi:hypothetical protein
MTPESGAGKLFAEPENCLKAIFQVP